MWYFKVFERVQSGTGEEYILEITLLLNWCEQQQVPKGDEYKCFWVNCNSETEFEHHVAFSLQGAQNNFEIAPFQKHQCNDL